MKRILIISPYFPPSNAADMQRVRMSLPYFKSLGWEAEVITIDTKHSHLPEDVLLLQSLPADLLVHKVGAFSRSWTSKFGLGSIALRSLLHLKKKGNSLIRKRHFDLIYFSTTQFPVCILGTYWKEKFNIPFVIDMQDPWHSEYYLNKPKNERPKKYWFSYHLNKYLEPIALQKVDGLISVSEKYIKDLKERYPSLENIPSQTITFGASEIDKQIVLDNTHNLSSYLHRKEGIYDLVYIGRGGNDMRKALDILFSAFSRGLAEDNRLFSKFKMNFIGTSYAEAGKGIKTILPVAEEYNLENYVNEETDRIPFYQGLATLQAADGLLVSGSDDPGYTASKIYPYIMAQKPFLGIFHPESSVVNIVETCNAGVTVTLDEGIDEAYEKLLSHLKAVSNNVIPNTDWAKFEPFTAEVMAKKQVQLFNQVIDGSN